MADAELLGGVPNSGSVENLLAGLLTHEDIQLWRYRDDGPPPGTPQPTSTSGQRVAVGWAVTKPAPPGGSATHTLAWSVGQQAFHADLVGEPVLAASTDSRTTAYKMLDPDQAAARRAADAVAACAARQIKADLYITNREYLHRLTRPIGRGVTFCTPREALALVGLYLRIQGEFLIWKDQSSGTAYPFDKGLYYWVGARELLPAGWRWYAACVAHSEGQDQTADARDLTYLGRAVFQRITRVLQARDELLRAMNCKQDNNVAEDALTSLDTCLVFLMGALDAVARIAHHVLGLRPDQAHHAGWQRSRWLQDVARGSRHLRRWSPPAQPGPTSCSFSVGCATPCTKPASRPWLLDSPCAARGRLWACPAPIATGFWRRQIAAAAGMPGDCRNSCREGCTPIPVSSSSDCCLT